jgi:anaerobic ribonucleoside-triphosphate reductase activating protein
MIKYIPQDTQVVFAEVPDEICLGLNLSLCPHHCPGCHSPYLREDIGEELTSEVLDGLIEKNPGITCVLFLGGDRYKYDLCQLAAHVSMKYGYKTAWYSGEESLDFYQVGWYFDYIKVGPYIENLGPLNNPHTNQRLYKISKFYNRHEIISEDITNKFWKNDNN